MDPASAAVAFVGFAGSIAALAAVVVESCKTLNNVWHSLKEAPESTRRLFQKLKRLEKIILEIQRVGELKDGGPTQSLDQHSWLENVTEMMDDFSLLKSKILKLEGNLSGKKISRKYLGALVRKIFSDEDIARFERVISGHMETFNMMLALHSQSVISIYTK